MSLMFSSQAFNTFPKSSGRKQCDCCPYGYHIDLDFVRYCESISNLELEPRRGSGSMGERRRSGMRRKRASMEVLLGLPSPSTSQQIRRDIIYGGEGQAKASPQVGDALQRAVMDFEETLERSSQPSQSYNSQTGCISAGEMKGDWFGGSRMGGVLKRRSLRKVSPVVELEGGREETQGSYYSEDGGPIPTSGNMSPCTLQNIREQMAASLERMRELEEQVKLIPVLQTQLLGLKLEKREIDLKLQSKEEELNTFFGLHVDEVLPNTSHQRGAIKSRSVAVGSSIMNRDVGVMHCTPLLATTGTNTNDDHLDEEKDQVSLKSIINIEPKLSVQNISIGTDLKMDQVYCQEDLNRNIDKAIKVYEKTFYHLLHPKKAILINIGIQTTTSCFDKREFGVQWKPVCHDFGASAKPNVNNFCAQSQAQTREIGISEHSVNDTCAKCSVKKCNVAVNFPEDIKYIPLHSLGSRSRSLGYFETRRKMFKSVGCGHKKSISICKYTDTSSLSEKKDIAINTMKRKQVDASVDSCQLPCQKCSNSTLSSKSSVSRIPRPTTLPVTLQSKTFNRQNTYSKFPPAASEKKLQSEEYSSDTSSEDGTYYTKEPNYNRTVDTTPLFQPIQGETHQKCEPSKEMRAAMKVLNDSLQKSPSGNVHNQVKNAINIIQQEWFKISGTATANPLDVEDYLDCFEEVSSSLLAYIVNMTDVTGNTAMHYAVSHGNFDVVSILLDSKVCNINHPNAAGYTCIMLVSLVPVRSETHRQVVRRLFHMADVNTRAKQHGQTALMLAASHGRIGTVELLLESGADINIQDEDGSTALMCAAEHGHIEIVKLLLAQPDCDVTITDNDGSTALNIAMEAGNRGIGVLLYAQEHFSRDGSPHTSSLKHRRAKSATPTFRTPPRTPSSPHPRTKPAEHSI